MVHYQPIVALPSGAVAVAVEALVRRIRGDRLIGPSEFVPHVERTPLVRADCGRQGRAALPTSRAAGTKLDASINVPYRMIDDGELVLGLERRTRGRGCRSGAPDPGGRPVRLLGRSWTRRW